MKYEFPVIMNLNDIRPHIAGNDEFIIAEREWGFVVNYLVNKEDTFPNDNSITSMIRRECRGLKFDKNGNILARPYHKFFNVNERNDTRLENIDFSKPHIILEKLDGSMIHPIKTTAFYDKDAVVYRLSSKMGITDVAINAETFVARNKKYDTFIKHCIANMLTPIFEWCSRSNRIVIDYPVDRLVLTAVRRNDDGSYYSYESLSLFAREYDIDLVRVIATEATADALMEEVRHLTDIEGYVVRFSDGHMVKIKAEDYLRMHRAKDSLTHEKNVIYIFFNDMYDDFRSALHGADRDNMDKFYNLVMNDFNKNVESFTTSINKLKTEYQDRKSFALNAQVSDILRKLMFKFWETSCVTHADVFAELKENVLRSCNSQTSVDRARHLWNNHKWNYGALED